MQCIVKKKVLCSAEESSVIWAKPHSRSSVGHYQKENQTSFRYWMWIHKVFGLNVDFSLRHTKSNQGGGIKKGREQTLIPHSMKYLEILNVWYSEGKTENEKERFNQVQSLPKHFIWIVALLLHVSTKSSVSFVTTQIKFFNRTFIVNELELCNLISKLHNVLSVPPPSQCGAPVDLDWMIWKSVPLLVSRIKILIYMTPFGSTWALHNGLI